MLWRWQFQAWTKLVSLKKSYSKMIPTILITHTIAPSHKKCDLAQDTQCNNHPEFETTTIYLVFRGYTVKIRPSILNWQTNLHYPTLCQQVNDSNFYIPTYQLLNETHNYSSIQIMYSALHQIISAVPLAKTILAIILKSILSHSSDLTFLNSESHSYY